MAAVDVVVVGLGPAGRALAHRCVARGLRVTAVDPHPERAWRATYGAWTDELPAWLPSSAVAACVARPSVWTTHRQAVERGYTVLSASGLHSGLELTGANVVAARATGVATDRVLLGGAGRLRGRVVVDARGVGAPVSLAQQTAYGVVLDADAIEGTWFMDWRADNGAAPGALPSSSTSSRCATACSSRRRAWWDGRRSPSTSYARACIVGSRRAGCGAGRHAGGTGALRGGGGMRQRCVAFGARGGLGHPCTGYSVAASLAAADAVADAIARASTGDRVHTPRTRAVDLLRRAGLRTLLAMPSADVATFFAAFFALPVPAQRAFLSRRDDPRAVAAAMARVFVAVPSQLRRRLVTSALGPRVARHIRTLPPS